jgi:hypothetical protein
VLVLCALALIPSNARSKKVGANSLDSRFI